MNTSNFESLIRLRIGEAHVHYGGGLVDGAFVLQLFGDVATELGILCDGDEGLFVGYEEIAFLAPVYSGDFIEARGQIIHRGNTSRKIRFEAIKVITARDVGPADSSADRLEEPLPVCRAVGTIVVQKNLQRHPAD